MADTTPIDEVLIDSLKLTGVKMRKKMVLREIINRWREIAGDLAEKISPVAVENGVLTLYSDDSAVKDNAKFLLAEFVSKINAKIGDGEAVITKIDFGKTFQKRRKKIRQAAVVEKKPAYDISDVKLSKREIAECEKKVDAMENVANREIMLETLINRAKYDKLKLKDGWHKCQLCDVLCEPADNLCGYCRVKEREKLQRAIRKIFVNAPQTHFREIQARMLTAFPHLRGECSLEFIEAVRMDLILQKAALVAYGDTTSDGAKFLVMLIRQLPEEELTEAIIARTLKEFRFNLADQPPFEQRFFTKTKAKLQRVNRR